MIVKTLYNIKEIEDSDICILFKGSKINNFGWEYKLSCQLSRLENDKTIIFLKQKDKKIKRYLKEWIY